MHSDRRHDAAGTRAEKSFELVRNALSDVIVVTFDELLQRLIEVEKRFSLGIKPVCTFLSPVCLSVADGFLWKLGQQTDAGQCAVCGRLSA